MPAHLMLTRAVPAGDPAGPDGGQRPPAASAAARATRRYVLGQVVLWLVATAMLPLATAPAPSALITAYLLLAPGDAIRVALRVRADELFLRLIYAASASVTVLTGTGLAASAVTAVIPVSKAATDLVALFTVLSIVMVTCLLVIARTGSGQVAGPVPGAAGWLALGGCAAAALAVSAGAALLDSTGSPALTAAVLAVLAAGVITAGTLDRELARRARPWLLFAFTLCITYAFSQRTGQLYGYDIHQEYGWAVRTLEAGRWTRTPGDAYGAMLSITSLPVTLSTITGSQLIVFFTTVAPVALALYQAGMFLFIRRFAPERAAFAATVLAGLMPQALWQLASVARQETGLLIFAALMLTVFPALPAGGAPAAARHRGTIAFACLLAVTLAVTHYTTAYITVSILAGGAIAAYLIRRYSQAARQLPRTGSLTVLAVLTAATLGWNTVYTQSSGNVQAVSAQVAVSAGLDDQHGGALERFLRGMDARSGTPAEYFFSTLTDAGMRPWKQVYSPPLQREFIAGAQPAEPPAHAGPMAAAGPAVLFGYTVLRQLANVLMAAGVIVLLLAALLPRGRPRQPGRAWHVLSRLPGADVPLDVTCVALAALAATAVTRFSSALAQSYNPERLLAQTALVLGIALAVLATWLLREARRKLPRLPATAVLAVLLTALTASSAGFDAVLTDRDAGHLIADGEHARRYRSTPGDRAAAAWLGSRYRFDDMVFTDAYGVLLLRESPRFRRGLFPELTPYTLDQRAYVLATTENVHGRAARVSARGVRTIFTFPEQFLSTYKSRVYSNGSAEVYR